MFFNLKKSKKKSQNKCKCNKSAPEIIDRVEYYLLALNEIFLYII